MARVHYGVKLAIAGAIAITGGYLGVSSAATTVNAEGDIREYNISDVLTPDSSINLVYLGKPFMVDEEGRVVVPTEEVGRTESGVTYLCSDGSRLFIEGTAVTVSQ